MVTIQPTDKGFKTQNCGTWSNDLSAVIPGPGFSDGQFIIGTDVRPGTYRSTGGTGCYWEREKDFSGGGSNSIIANNNTDGPSVVTINAGDAGFKSKSCGDWSRA